jgi:proline iminopeptidase
MRRIIQVASCLLAACAGPQHRAPVPSEGHVATGDSVQLYYRIAGDGPDTVVVVHGGPGFTHDYFFDDLAPMAGRHTLIFYDQRGAGKSTLVRDSAGLDARRFVDDLEAVRRHFALERLTILGHSWGAAVAALYAQQYPERVERLLIVGGVPVSRRQLQADFERLQAARTPSELERMEDLMAARTADPGDADACHAYYSVWFTRFFADSSMLRRSRGDFCAGTAESRRNKIEAVDRYVFASLGDWDWSQTLGGVTARTLIVRGSRDVLSGEDGWLAALPNARVLLLEGVGHFPYLEEPDRFYPAVDTFLAGGWPDGARAKSGG